MLLVGDITQLVADTLRTANDRIDVRVRVTIDPILDAALCDVVFQFHGKSPVRLAAFKPRIQHPE